MDNKIISYCKECNKEFLSPRLKNRKFCSKECYWSNGSPLKGMHKVQKKNRPCLYCNSLVRPPLTTCNRECYDKNRSRIIKDREIKCIQCMHYFSPGRKTTKYCSYDYRKEHEKPAPRKCVNCKILFSPILFRNNNLYRPKHRKTCSNSCMIEWIKNNEERKEKISFAFKGEKHPNWQGGTSLDTQCGFRGYNWKDQRLLALDRDGHKCINCGLTDNDSKEKYGSSLDVDHIIKFHSFKTYEDANKLDNLQCLCKSCHRIEEAKKDKSTLSSRYGNTKRTWKKDIFSINNATSNAKLRLIDVMVIKRLFINHCTARHIHNFYNHLDISSIYNIGSEKTWKSTLPLTTYSLLNKKTPMFTILP